MICPHCSADLKRKQRPSRRCSRCKRPFALEPTDNVLHLHDLRMRRLAAWLSDPGRPGAAPLPYTVEQLRFAASRKFLGTGVAQGIGGLGALGLLGVVVVVGALGYQLVGAFWFLFVMAALVVGAPVIRRIAAARGAQHPGEPITSTGFGALVQQWVQVYGAPPPGMLPPGPVPDVWPPAPPRAILYCTDASVVAFLAATGVPQRRGVALVDPTGAWPPPGVVAALRADAALPVLVLHDADRDGCLTVPRLRAALPPGTHIVDAGLAPRFARKSGPAVRRQPDPAVLDGLEAAGLTDDERSWLAAGNSLPLVAVRPARLLRAVERALARTDPEERRAAALGFLEWPEAAR